MQSVKTYFVTGATGAIGSALAPLLLAQEDARVCLLVRADSGEAARERLEALHRFWGVPSENAGVRNRVWAVRGDVTAPRFGLEAAEHAALRADCTHIIHTAGLVRMNLPLEEARRAAVGAAHQVVELARACSRLEKVEFVSTVGVGGHLAVVPETWLSEPRAFHNTYEQAKAEAEVYIQGEVERGLPLTVHRPSMVVGETATGRIIHFQIFYHLCEFLSGRRTFGLFPRLGTVRLDTIPVDGVARAIVWANGRPELAGRVLHLCAGPERATPLTELRERVRNLFAARGLRVPPCISLPPRVFSGMLHLASRFMDAETRRAAATLPVFLEYLASEQRFENAATRGLLEEAGIVVPGWASYIDAVLGAYLDAKITSRPAAARRAAVV